jgi:hypothetical protein
MQTNKSSPELNPTFGKIPNHFPKYTSILRGFGITPLIKGGAVLDALGAQQKKL